MNEGMANISHRKQSISKVCKNKYAPNIQNKISKKSMFMDV